MVLASPTLPIEQSPGDESRSHRLAAAKPPRQLFLDITISRIEVSSRSAKTPFRLGKAKRHRDASALFGCGLLEPSASSGCYCLREFALTTDKFEIVSDLSTGNHQGSLV